MKLIRHQPIMYFDFSQSMGVYRTACVYNDTNVNEARYC